MWQRIHELKINQVIRHRRVKSRRTIRRRNEMRKPLCRIETCQENRIVKCRTDLADATANTWNRLSVYQNRSIFIASIYSTRSHDVVKREVCSAANQDAIKLLRRYSNIVSTRTVTIIRRISSKYSIDVGDILRTDKRRIFFQGNSMFAACISFNGLSNVLNEAAMSSF